MASVAELELEYQRLVTERNALGERYEAGEKNLLPQIKDLGDRIRAVLQQIGALNSRNSAGDIVRDDQAARVEVSVTQDPPASLQILENGRVRPPPDTTTPSNATVPVLDDRAGTQAQNNLRPLVITQGTQVDVAAAGSSSQGVAPSAGGVEGRADAVPGGRPGVGAAGDDEGSRRLVSSLNAIQWDEFVKTQNNVLGQYASYSYQASLYLIDRSNYERILNTGSKDLSNSKLLIQSGGAPPAGRSDFFSLDYYIDKIELKSFFAGKAVRLAHNVKEARITVVEPNGISFVQNLDAAVQQYFGISTGVKRNFASQLFLLVIKFYGYDQQGNLVRGGRSSNQITNQTSDPNAFVEKFYPLIITKLDFRIANKAVEYDIHFKAPPYYINASQGRGTIPFQFEFSGKTVKDILAGPDIYNAGQAAVSADSALPNEIPNVDPSVGRFLRSAAPANASAAPTSKLTVRPGLMQRLNAYQAQLEKAEVIQYRDEYNIEFVIDTLASATIIKPGVNKGTTSMAQPGTPADQKLPIKTSMDVNTQTESVLAGTQIVQFIDRVLRGSSYIRDQQTEIFDDKTQLPSPGPGQNLKNTTWYRIGFKAVPMLDKYDEKRNDYAYKITYTISPYYINQLNSPYFNPPVYRGVHKQYKYWFTGENTEVISYEESLNNLYYIALTNTNLGGATSSREQAASTVAELKYLPTTASGQSTQGGANPKTQEPAANAADQLYSPSDLKEGNLTIVGDPAWLQQGEAFVALNKNNPDYFKAFLSDGTINFDAQQILFEIAFNAPRDYNLATGLAQPSADRLNSTTQLDQVTRTPGPAQFSRIYIAKECTSVFEKGKFIQHLKGSLMIYYPPGKGQGRPLPQAVARASTSTSAAVVAAAAKASTPAWARPTSVTGQTPTSSTARAVDAALRPPSQLSDPTLTQLKASPVFIQARRANVPPAEALERARAAFAAGTNNYQGTALPGIRDTSGTAPGAQPIVKDSNPG